MQAEEEGWGESGVLAAGHSVASAALHTLPGPCIPRVVMLRRAGDAGVSRGRRKCPASLVGGDSPLGLERTGSQGETLGCILDSVEWIPRGG